ncbi:RNA ligase/cyclic nucleotide phosphodiesterase [Mycena galopus ATCC 62051]|nr:RNA ligase/cyclic nucleotide phosphodiesterase [Mycena galopus ATCC 62051]
MSSYLSPYKTRGPRPTLSICMVLLVSLGVYFHYAMTPSPEVLNLSIEDSEPKYPIGVPEKFDPDGNVQPYPGNTVIAHLSQSSELHKSLRALHEKLKSSHLSHLYALLPLSSWHMTIFEGVAEYARSVPGRWPDDLPLNASLALCNSLYEEKLSSFDLQCDPPYHLAIMGFSPLVAGITLHLEPYTSQENARLRNLRNRLSSLLHIRAKGHDNYGFHMSMAYLLRFPTEEQDMQLMKLLTDHFEDEMPKEFELGPPEFCSFEDMFAFKPLLYLKNQ